MSADRRAEVAAVVARLARRWALPSDLGWERDLSRGTEERCGRLEAARREVATRPIVDPSECQERSNG